MLQIYTCTLHRPGANGIDVMLTICTTHHVIM